MFNPLDPLLLMLSEDFIDEEDLSNRLKRLFKVKTKIVWLSFGTTLAGQQRFKPVFKSHVRVQYV